MSAGRWRGLEICGTKGTLRSTARGFEIMPDKADPARRPDPALHASASAAPPAPPRTEAVKDDGYEQVRDQFVPHVRELPRRVRSRATPISDLAERPQHRNRLPPGQHRHARRAHVRWDDASHRTIVGDAEASRLLTKTYRARGTASCEAAFGRV